MCCHSQSVQLQKSSSIQCTGRLWCDAESYLPRRNKSLASVQQTSLFNLVFMRTATGQLLSSQLSTDCGGQR